MEVSSLQVFALTRLTEIVYYSCITELVHWQLKVESTNREVLQFCTEVLCPDSCAHSDHFLANYTSMALCATLYTEACCQHLLTVKLWESCLRYILYYTILYYTILYYTTLYYTILYYTILYVTHTSILHGYILHTEVIICILCIVLLR
jgi:hypothetical protein